uniref:Uncharacterized protein n=1 Tax=Timema bartmani TaxID=61472 RepID=A0A7R9I8D6_9NEOP|nr:unnamed protein product [Timema bartmani]
MRPPKQKYLRLDDLSLRTGEFLFFSLYLVPTEKNNIIEAHSTDSFGLSRGPDSYVDQPFMEVLYSNPDSYSFKYVCDVNSKEKQKNKSLLYRIRARLAVNWWLDGKLAMKIINPLVVMDDVEQLVSRASVKKGPVRNTPKTKGLARCQASRSVREVDIMRPKQTR